MEMETSFSSPLLPVYSHIPFTPTRGCGVELFDSSGRAFIDFYGGHAVALLGYNHPQLVETLQREARRLFFQSNAVPLPERERAAARLTAFAGLTGFSVFFVNSGAEANENALRIACRTTGRSGIVAVEGAFHGRTAAAAAVTWNSGRWFGFPRRPVDPHFVPLDDPGPLEAAIDDTTAAVILEPVQGVAGARPLAAEFIHRARELTQARGALLIADEVQCGMGRSGHPFVTPALGIRPDILTVAKGLAGGFPAGALLIAPHLAPHLAPGDLGTTFGGGPLAVALIETVIDAVEREQLLPRVRRLSARLIEEGRTGPVSRVQGRGFLLGLVTAPPAQVVAQALRGRGLLVGGSSDPHTMRLLPPLILEDSHVDRLIEVLADL